MHEITESNVLRYLHDTGRLPRETSATGTTLAWGVSNVVLRVHPESGPDFVVKQSREKLRTKADWFSRLDRIWREMDVMKALAPLLPAGVIPRILFEDRENFAFGMEAIDARHVVWKEELLAGRADVSVAAILGAYLAAIHRETAGVVEFEAAFGNREVFDELRIDPYYRYIANAHPDLRPAIDELIASTFATKTSIVHADFSPKNVLLTETDAGSRNVSLVDFETGHYGDPAFDHGFFLAHLLLKTIKFASRRDEYLALAREFWNRYRTDVVLTRNNPPARAPFPIEHVERQAVKHLGACLLSRIDGKSTVDYLPQANDQSFAREFSRILLLAPPTTLDATFRQFDDMLGAR